MDNWKREILWGWENVKLHVDKPRKIEFREMATPQFREIVMPLDINLGKVYHQKMAIAPTRILKNWQFRTLHGFLQCLPGLQTRCCGMGRDGRSYNSTAIISIEEIDGSKWFTTASGSIYQIEGPCHSNYTAFLRGHPLAKNLDKVGQYVAENFLAGIKFDPNLIKKFDKIEVGAKKIDQRVLFPMMEKCSNPKASTSPRIIWEKRFK